MTERPETPWWAGRFCTLVLRGEGTVTVTIPKTALGHLWIAYGPHWAVRRWPPAFVVVQVSRPVEETIWDNGQTIEVV